MVNTNKMHANFDMQVKKYKSYQFVPSVKLALSAPGRSVWGNECKETLRLLPNNERQLLQGT